jgi:RNA polymerase sigma factor (sigma-70 family)
MDDTLVSDDELVAQARAGDRLALGRLHERCEPLVLRACRRMLGNTDLAHDLAQEAMLQAFLSLDRLRADASFRSWLYGIALNVCRSFIRAQAQLPYSLEAMAGGLAFGALPFSVDATSPQAVAEERELQRMVFAAVESLPPSEREATLLFYYEQLSLHEIATALGISRTAAKGRLYKSRLHLRDRLMAFYPEWADTVVRQERGKAMIKVTVADLVTRENKVEGVERPLLMFVVVLFDEAGLRMLPIWVGPAEGQGIAMGVRKHALPRPMTFEFTASILAASGATLEEVRIESLRDETFYAVAKIRNGNTVKEIDARPSDALGLAVRTGCPIYVTPEVMEKAGSAIPANAAGPEGRGIDQLIQGFEESMKKTKPWRVRTPEEIEKSHEELVAAVFRREEK